MTFAVPNGPNCFESELRRGGAFGVQTPEVDGQLPGDRDNGFLALGAGGTCAFAEHAEPFLHRWILRLKTHESPGALHEHGTQSPVATFGHTARHPFVGSIRITGDMLGSAIRSDGKIGVVKISGDLRANTANDAIISARGDLTATTPGKAIAIRGLFVGSVDHA